MSFVSSVFDDSEPPWIANLLLPLNPDIVSTFDNEEAIHINGINKKVNGVVVKNVNGDEIGKGVNGVVMFDGPKLLPKPSKVQSEKSLRLMEKRKYEALRRRQIKMETEEWEKTAEEYKVLQKEMCEKQLAPSLPYVKSLFLGWFEPLRVAIEKEQFLQETTKRKKAFRCPQICLLPADKIAVIVMHKVMGLLMSGEAENYVRVIHAAMSIAEAIEVEVKIHIFLEKTKKVGSKKNSEEGALKDVTKDKENLRKHAQKLLGQKKLMEIKKLLAKEQDTKSWCPSSKAKLGSRLIDLLTESAYLQPPINQMAECLPEIRPAFRHTYRTIMIESSTGRRIQRKYGVIQCDQLVRNGLESTAMHMVIPYIPMLIPPKAWKGYNIGGHLFLPSYVMRTHGAQQQQLAIKNTPKTQLGTVFKALNTLGRAKWRVNKRVLDVLEILWAKGGNIAGLVSCAKVDIPQRPLSEDVTEIIKWKRSVAKAKKCNRERHAQQCDVELKLSVAKKLRDEEGFYYPHNLDFRGRAYPLHPHLNHLNSDLCRGILEFAEGRPLGKTGLHWLKMHLANLYGGGVKKLSHEDRLDFVENHLFDVLDSADNPIDGNCWWLNAEDPFQCLAACINLSDALKSLSPHDFISYIPVHQDGSCNGLQHYAALGRDSLEATSVNLVNGERPVDVYSEIASRVYNIIKHDSKKDPSTYPTALFAKILIEQVDRKLVKQTVMTSVYGVTYIGARDQIRKRLQEKGQITDDKLLFSASCYAAKVTLAALGELFQAARRIMVWLGDCAKIIASENQAVKWTTPLGLPVVQPYRKSQQHLVHTSLQTLSLQREGDLIDVKKQRTAFPPNFVHSLDGTHMMMTAVACNDAGLQFAGVHDSFWTHAGDVDTMNVILRKKFVELYQMPILENLLESFETSFPTLKFPPLPDRGGFDLSNVLESPYFFN